MSTYGRIPRFFAVDAYATLSLISLHAAAAAAVADAADATLLIRCHATPAFAFVAAAAAFRRFRYAFRCRHAA